PRLLAYRDHLNDHVWEKARVLHGTLQALAGGDLVLHGVDGILVNDVAGGARDGFQSFHQRHACREHGGKSAGIARDSCLVKNRAYDRDLENYAVEDFSHALRALLEIDEGVDGCADYHGQEYTLFLHEPRHVDHHLGERRQVRAETLEQGLELRNHEDQQDA